VWRRQAGSGRPQNRSERYREQRKVLVSQINELKAGLSFASVHSVYDCGKRMDMARTCAQRLRELEAGPGKDVTAKLKELLAEAETALQQSDQEYGELLAKVDGGQGDIGVIVRLLGTERLRRVYGSWIERISGLTGRAPAEMR
jgi:hypothetical protein